MIYMHTFHTTTSGIKIKADKKSITKQDKNHLFAWYFITKQCTAALLTSQNNAVAKHNGAWIEKVFTSWWNNKLDLHLLFLKGAYCIYCLKTQQIQQREQHKIPL